MSASETGYQALRESAAWIDLTGRGHLRVTGEDRVRLLHAMTTNHVQQLLPGQGCYAFFLNAQGQILADVNILMTADSLLLDTEPETRQLICEHLDKYIIADDVTVEDLTGETAVLGLEGPESPTAAAALGLPAPETPCSHIASGGHRIARLNVAGAPGFRLFTSRANAALPQGRLPLADSGTRHTVRLERGRPRYGEDITEKHLPHETQLLDAVHFDKGCYLGQEIVERVRSRGMIHRRLARLRIETAAAPAPGAIIHAGSGEAGYVTSTAFSPALGCVVALGYLQTGAKPPLSVEGAAVTVEEAPPTAGLG